MKKITLFFAMALAALSVSAQGLKFGAEIGYAHDIMKMKIGGLKGSDGINGIQVGPVLHYGFDEHLGIKTGLLYKYAGEKVLEINDYKTSKRFHDLTIPVQFVYTHNFSDNFGIYGFVGPKLNLGLSYIDRNKEEKVYKYNHYNGKAKFDGEDVSDKNHEGDTKRFDVKLGFGVGVNFLKNFYGQLSIDFGLLNRIKDNKDAELMQLDDDDWYWDDDDDYYDIDDADVKMHMNAFQLSVGYYF